MKETKNQKILENKTSFKTASTNIPIKSSDEILLSYWKDSNSYDEKAIFDRNYLQSINLICGDKLLRPSSSFGEIVIRKTATDGIYKLLLTTDKADLPEIKIIDEAELLNNKKYAKGTISKINDDLYEVTYFSDEDDMELEHFSKMQVIKFMKEKKLIF